MLLVSLVPRLRPISPASLAGLSPKPPGRTRTRYLYVPNRTSVINVGFNEYVQPNARLWLRTSERPAKWKADGPPATSPYAPGDSLVKIGRASRSETLLG